METEKQMMRPSNSEGNVYLPLNRRKNELYPVQNKDFLSDLVQKQLFDAFLEDNWPKNALFPSNELNIPFFIYPQ